MPFGVVNEVGREMGVLDRVHVQKGKEVLAFSRSHWFEWRVFEQKCILCMAMIA